MTIYKLPVSEDELKELTLILCRKLDSNILRDLYKKSLFLSEVARTEREAQEARTAYDKLIGYNSIDDDLYIPDRDNEDETDTEDI